MQLGSLQKKSNPNIIVKMDCVLHSCKAVSLLAKCNLKQYDGHRWGCIFQIDWWSVKWEVGSGPVSTSAWKERRSFWWIHYVPEQNKQTHPHGWRGAPRAGLAVSRPEGAIVPRNRRVELQLMPLFLEGRRIRRDFHWPCTVGVVAVALALCLEGVLIC